MADSWLPIARSPIAPVRATRVVDGWERPGESTHAALRLDDLSHLTKVQATASAAGRFAAAMDLALGRCAVDGAGSLLVRSGPVEWIVIGSRPSGEIRADLHARAGTEFVTVVDLTHARALMRLEGAGAPQLLAKVCALDLSDRVAPPGSSFRSSVAKVVTDVVVPPLDPSRPGKQPYLLHVDGSLGQYLFDSLLDAGEEFGIVAG